MNDLSLLRNFDIDSTDCSELNRTHLARQQHEIVDTLSRTFPFAWVPVNRKYMLVNVKWLGHILYRAKMFKYWNEKRKEYFVDVRKGEWENDNRNLVEFDGNLCVVDI